jgi:hypothetical protein
VLGAGAKCRLDRFPLRRSHYRGANRSIASVVVLEYLRRDLIATAVALT